MEEKDEYQERYLDHQERKTSSLESFKGTQKPEYTLLEQTALKEIMMNRRSQRIFSKEPIAEESIKWLITAVQIAPSSCNRQAIYLKEADPIQMEQYLVGGKRWINNANKVYLLFASKEAYKSPNEKTFMPFLDAGFVGQNIYLMAEALGLGCCYVNPNIRPEQQPAFQEQFGDDYFCGAVAIGNYLMKAKQPPLRELQKVLIKNL